MFALTGASGWLGRNAIDAFDTFQTFNPSSSLRLFTSNGRDIYGRSSSRLRDILQVSDYAGLFHTAFAKRAVLNNSSVDQYTQQNRSISHLVTSFVEQSSPDLPVVVTSSGIARTPNARNSLNDDPYAYLKREEEIAISRLSSDRMVVIFRLYGAIGPHLDLAAHYALSSFISQSLSSGLIQISSNSSIYRGYVYLPTFCELVWSLLSNPLPPGCYYIDACSYVFTIRDLAYLVAHEMGSRIENSVSISTSDLSYYCGDVQPYLQLLSDRNICEPTLSDQLKFTINGCR